MYSHEREPINAVKVIVYLLSLASLGYLIWKLVQYFDFLYPAFKEFCLEIPSPMLSPCGITSSEIVLCVLSGVMLLAGTIVYLANMSNRGYAPIGMVPFVCSSVFGFLMFGLYFLGLFFKRIEETAPLPTWTIVTAIIGAVGFLGLFVYFIIAKTYRAVPLCLLYLFLGFCMGTLIALVFIAVLYLIAIALIAVVMLCGGQKKRIVDKDGTVYEEI